MADGRSWKLSVHARGVLSAMEGCHTLISSELPTSKKMRPLEGWWIRAVIMTASRRLCWMRPNPGLGMFRLVIRAVLSLLDYLNLEAGLRSDYG